VVWERCTQRISVNSEDGVCAILGPPADCGEAQALLGSWQVNEARDESQFKFLSGRAAVASGNLC